MIALTAETEKEEKVRVETILRQSFYYAFKIFRECSYTPCTVSHYTLFI